MIGKRRTIMISLFAAALGSLIAAFAPNIELVIAGRVVQGLAAGIFPLTYGIIRDEFPAAKLPGMIGAVSAIIAIGSGLGTVLAGPIDALFGWRALFWIPMLVFLGGAAATRLVVPESEVRNGGSINWLAATLLAGWLVALLLPLSFGTQWGWTSLNVIGLSLAAIVLFATWVAVESNSANPLIDMKLMRLTPIWTNNLASLLFGASMFGVFAFLPQLAQMPAAAGFGFGASVTQSGFLILPMTLAMAVAGFFSGRLSALIGAKYQLVGSAGGTALRVPARPRRPSAALRLRPVHLAARARTPLAPHVVRAARVRLDRGVGCAPNCARHAQTTRADRAESAALRRSAAVLPEPDRPPCARRRPGVGATARARTARAAK
jgi:MFS family permease